jgi:glycosyltransferase involved in cell wall biosynthesis
MGLLGRSVFFLESWVAYDERQNYLLEADIGVSAHPATVESRFSFRTRVLDYIWAALPMILSAGDDFGDLVERESLGAAIGPGDVQAWGRAILRLAEDRVAMEQVRARLRERAPSFEWRRVAEPLLRYCEAPYKTIKDSPLRRKLIPLLSSGYELARGMRG